MEPTIPDGLWMVWDTLREEWATSYVDQVPMLYFNEAEALAAATEWTVAYNTGYVAVRVK